MRTQTLPQQQSTEIVFPVASEFFAQADASRMPGTPETSCVEAQGQSRDELVMEHLPMVRFVARRIYERMPRHVEFEDLVSAGVLGLLDAASKFDWAKQVQFKSYAQFRVRGAILDSLRILDWGPRELRRKGRAMAEAIRVLSGKTGRTPSDAEIAAEMGMELSTYQHMIGELKSLEMGSLNAERTEEVGDEELEYVPAPTAQDPLELCIKGQSREQLLAAAEALPEKERMVLQLYYFDQLTMREIGLALSVGESRVSQIRSSALARLRKALSGRPSPAMDARTRRSMD